nr:protein ALTERED XYLOGLUCAN 4-like [Ipomoea batatas]
MVQEESPTSISKDEEEKFTTTWHFPHHNFTLKVLRSVFLIRATEKVKSNGQSTNRFHLLLDQLDPNWTQNISNVDYAIFSDGQWFLRPIYLHEAGNLAGCIFCREPNVKDLGAAFAIRKVFKAAFKYVNERRRGIVVFMRTFSPSHFEHGAWHNGGNIQVEEFERAKRDGEKRGNRFGIIDVTRAMMMRPDGHPGEFWGNRWMKGHSDCLHWKDREFSLLGDGKPDSVTSPVRFQSVLSIVQGKDKWLSLSDQSLGIKWNRLWPFVHVCFGLIIGSEISLEESPNKYTKDEEEKIHKQLWHFPHHNFTLQVSAQSFLIDPHRERKSNGQSTNRSSLAPRPTRPKLGPNISTWDYAIFSTANGSSAPSTSTRPATSPADDSAAKAERQRPGAQPSHPESIQSSF